MVESQHESGAGNLPFSVDRPGQPRLPRHRLHRARRRHQRVPSVTASPEGGSHGQCHGDGPTGGIGSAIARTLIPADTTSQPSAVTAMGWTGCARSARRSSSPISREQPRCGKLCQVPTGWTRSSTAPESPRSPRSGTPDLQYGRRRWHVTGAAELTRLMLPALRGACGHVVFVNASPGMRAVPRWSAFVGSKAALRELADSLREEEEHSGVQVTTVYPAGTATERLRRVRAAFGRDYDPAR
jgi:short chain dehydrogenase